MSSEEAEKAEPHLSSWMQQEMSPGALRKPRSAAENRKCFKNTSGRKVQMLTEVACCVLPKGSKVPNQVRMKAGNQPPAQDHSGYSRM